MSEKANVKILTAFLQTLRNCTQRPLHTVKELHPSQIKHNVFLYSSTIIDVLDKDQ